MNCLAAMIVSHFKTSPGGFYLYNPQFKSQLREEFTYLVKINSDNKIVLEIGQNNFMGEFKEDVINTLFKGSLIEFINK